MTDSKTAPQGAEPQVVALARALLSCPSVTPDAAGAIEVLQDFLLPLHFSLQVEHTPNGTTNAWIVHGFDAPVFVFGGHVDVVSPGDLSKWTTPPFEPDVRDGKLYARGASDMKGSVAAAACAFARFVREHPDHPGTLAMLITSDEEGDGLEGTARMVKTLRRWGVHIDWCIVGEPSCAARSGDTIKNGRRGSLNGRLVVHGKQGHVAYPQLADNPVHKAAAFLAELSSRVWDEGTEHFLPSSLQISNIHAGHGVVNIIPGELEVLFNIRYNTCWTQERLIEEIEAMARRRDLSCEFFWKSSAQPFVTRPGRMTRVLSEAVERVTGCRPQLNTAGGTSDARFLSTISDETVEFGPMNATIHSINECVGVDELVLLEEIYLETITRLFLDEE